MSQAVSETVAKADMTKSPASASELLYADAGDVEATTVTMERSGAEHVTAQRVIMDHSDTKRLDARSAQLDRSGVLVLQSQHAVMQGGTAGLVQASEVRFVKSRALAVVSGTTRVEGELKTIVHIGPVEGNLRPLVDGDGALRLGVGLGLAFVVFGRLLRRLVGGR